MLIKKDGIYKTIDSKDFGIYQPSGWEKIVVDAVVKAKNEKEDLKPEPIVEEIKIEEETIVPKPKKKKKA